MGGEITYCVCILPGQYETTRPRAPVQNQYTIRTETSPSRLPIAVGPSVEVLWPEVMITICMVKHREKLRRTVTVFNSVEEYTATRVTAALRLCVRLDTKNSTQTSARAAVGKRKQSVGRARSIRGAFISPKLSITRKAPQRGTHPIRPPPPQRADDDGSISLLNWHGNPARARDNPLLGQQRGPHKTGPRQPLSVRAGQRAGSLHSLLPSSPPPPPPHPPSTSFTSPLRPFPLSS